MKRKPLVYIASPYEHRSELVMAKRADDIAHITKEIIIKQDAIIPFSPIAYAHQFGSGLGFDWVSWDLQFLSRCDAMMIVELADWGKSKGIEIEEDFARQNDIPIYYAPTDKVLLFCEVIALELAS